PGAGNSFSASYPAPLNTCSISDTLTATGKDKCTGNIVTNTATTTCPISVTPLISVTLACPPQIAAGGTSMTLSGAVSNTGNVTLNNVFVTINQPGNNTPVIGPISLAPGASSSFSSSFT